MTTHTPLRCANSVMAQRGTHEVVLLDTGNYPSYNDFLNQTWTWNGTDCTNASASLINSGGPLPGRTNSVMAYDGTNIMLFGGQGSTSAVGMLDDTWLWNGTSWSQASLGTFPFSRRKAQAAYLAGTGVVMFGGENLLYRLLETWIWNGSNWSLVSLGNGASPSARINHMMAASSSVVMLFGGETTKSLLNDTWTFNGTSWTQLTPATSPSVRSDACMSYDSVNGIWVMFGGMNSAGYLNETWAFNGTTWTQVTGTQPGARIGAQMCFDTQSGTTLMYGGISAGTNYPSNETWAFNGSTLTWAKL